MSVTVDIYKVPEPVQQEAKVVSFIEKNEISFSDEEFLQHSMDLNSVVEGNKGVTFYARVTGGNIGSGYRQGDVLVVDRGWPLQDNKLAVCCINNVFLVKRIKLKGGQIWLESGNNNGEEAILLEEGNQLEIWGMVIYEIKRVW